MLDLRAARGEHLFLDAADRQHLAAQRDLAGHGEVAADFALGERRDNRRRQRDPRRGTFLRDSAFGQVDVNVEVLEIVVGHVEVFGARAQIAERRLRRFLHHVAERSGQHAGLPLPGSTCTSIVRMSPPKGVHAMPVATPTSSSSLARMSSNGAGPRKRLRCLTSMFAGMALVFGDQPRDLAADVGDLAVEVAHARFVGVFADQRCAATASLKWTL